MAGLPTTRILIALKYCSLAMQMSTRRTAMAGRLWIGAANASALVRRSASLFCLVLGANQAKSYQEVSHRMMMEKKMMMMQPVKMIAVMMMVVVMMQLTPMTMVLLLLLMANSKRLARDAISCSNCGCR
jgi:hypothetical protein